MIYLEIEIDNKIKPLYKHLLVQVKQHGVKDIQSNLDKQNVIMTLNALFLYVKTSIWNNIKNIEMQLKYQHSNTYNIHKISNN